MTSIDRLCGLWKVIASIDGGIETSTEVLLRRAHLVVDSTIYFPDGPRVYGSVSYFTEVSQLVFDESIAALAMLVVFGRTVERDERFHIWSGGIMRLSDDPDYHSIDLVPYYGEPRDDLASQGIYRCDGDRFTLCTAKFHRAPRPTTIDEQGPHIVQETMERVRLG